MMFGGSELLLDLGALPFHIGVMDTPSNGALPDSLPFAVGIHPETGLLVQMPNRYVAECLETAYHRGSIIGTPMAEDGFGRRYTEDFLDFIMHCLGKSNLNNSRLLEIGCGTGYLLHRFQRLGADVIGIEPGSEGQAGAKRYGVKILQDVFPGSNIAIESRYYDIIVHYAVLEHVADPLEFLKIQSHCLKDEGLIFVAVPNCQDYIDTGDISMFVHEHWSYFTPSSLNALASMAGLKLLRSEPSKYGNLVYAMLGRGEVASRLSPTSFESLSTFAGRVHRNIERAGQRLEKMAGNPLGIFVPARAINLLTVVQTSGLYRFFDDDPSAA